MITKKLSADEFAQKLLHDRAFRKDAYQAFYDRCYQLPELDGVLSSDVLHQLIRKAKTSRALQSMLAELLYLVDADSVCAKYVRDGLCKSQERTRSQPLCRSLSPICRQNRRRFSCIHRTFFRTTAS